MVIYPSKLGSRVIKQRFGRCRIGLRGACDGERRKSGVKVSSSGRRALTAMLRFRFMHSPPDMNMVDNKLMYVPKFN